MNINYVSYFLQGTRVAQYKKKKLEKLPFASVSHSDTLDSSMKALRNIVKDLIPYLQVEWNSEQVHPSGLGMAVKYGMAWDITEYGEIPSATLWN